MSEFIIEIYERIHENLWMKTGHEYMIEYVAEYMGAFMNESMDEYIDGDLQVI